ncbi:uncharacterized protein LOC120003136 [Tripterygium wilfordii]|uniref:uncharacterized protein LOC120003136 n=1 Tax=Tripterygium wilfordii TaxID=458696 RepID=UPI0018F82F81|nr:uncharacterized protein LOC120003136 [Tripterygium wilfordii]XP_038707978.1 uncharacterized protein LOC120003136 [Tripterygium wilfordii]XP_038707980.1 uncharacterized protein LOC120003136 [Tripterygium wilfordii]
MRRPGDYADSGPNSYPASQMQHMSGQRVEHDSGQRMEQDSGHFAGMLEAFTPEREQPYVAPKAEGHWRWERDESKNSNPVPSQMFNEGQGRDALRSFYLDQRPDQNLLLDKQGNNDLRSWARDEDMQIGYEDKPLSLTFEGLEQKFLDDIAKLAKEQNDAEDAEYARHRERINAINGEYQEQLASLRAQHASRRDEFLRKETDARQNQYQQAIRDHYTDSGVGLSDRRGHNGLASAAAAEAHRAYNTTHYDSHRGRARFLGGARDRGFEPRGSYPGGHGYDTGSRYY